MTRSSAIRFYLPLLAILLALFAIEIAFLPMPGIEEDEALFALPFLSGHLPLYSWTIEHARVPVMLMDYIGGLKTWIYSPVFQIWRPSAWSIRLPVCFLSLLTIWILAEFLRRATTTGVALLSALLLATDAPFLFTNVFDWGPVCLLLLSTVSFLYLFRGFDESGKRRYLGAAFLVAGIAVWYKAIFLVLLAALAFACLTMFSNRSRKWMSVPNVVVAVVAFAIGAMPLIVFNWQRGAATLTATRYLPPVPVSEKLMMLRHTLDGRALEHYMFRSFPGEMIPLTGAPLADLVTEWYERSSFHPGSLLLPALILALVALPFLRSSQLFRPLLFAWTAFLAAEVAMILFRDAGAGPHHTVLLDPAPQFIAAATVYAIQERTRQPLLSWAVGVVMIGANLWLLDSYYTAGKKNGFSVYWTGGGANLAGKMVSASLPAAILDWGIQSELQVQTHDRVTIVEVAPVRPGVLYVGHCAGYIIDQTRIKPYETMLRSVGTVNDRHGNPLFCLYESRN